MGCAHSGFAGWAGTVRCSFRRLAETLDANLGTGEDTQDVMRLLLIASLANVTNAVKGLTVTTTTAAYLRDQATKELRER